MNPQVVALQAQPDFLLACRAEPAARGTGA